MTSRYAYPFVECDEHPGPQRHYVVCVHVISGQQPKHIYPASDSEGGEILCQHGREHPAHELRLVCAKHAESLLRSIN